MSIWDGIHDGLTNMSRDAALLSPAELGQAGARVYRWSEPTVSLGMFQNPERDLLNPAAIAWVMRPTGGKAVLHGHDETVAIAMSLSALQVNSRSVREVYRAVIAPLLNALRACGLEAELGEHTRFAKGVGRTADCFAHVSANDIVNPVTGMKVCGCALRLTDRAVLIQASIPNGPPLVDPQAIFSQPSLSVAPGWDAEGLSPALEYELRRSER